MPQPRSVAAIASATVSNATSWVLTAADVAVDTQTITIGGVVFTSVTTIGSAAGNFLIGASAAASLTNLAGLINNPTSTNTTRVALSAVNADKVKFILGLSAVATATTLTITSSTDSQITVSETETNWSWASVYTSKGIPIVGFGRGSIQFVAASITSGNAVFTVNVSNDGVNWTAYNRLTTNATNTNAQTDARVASVTLSSNGTSMVFLQDAVEFYQVVTTITTDGTYSANVLLN